MDIYDSISRKKEQMVDQSLIKQRISLIQWSNSQKLAFPGSRQNEFIQLSSNQLYQRNKIQEEWINKNLTSKSLQIKKGNIIEAEHKDGVIVSRMVIRGKYEFGVRLCTLKGVIGIGIIDKQFVKQKKLLETPHNNVFINMSNGEQYHGNLAILQRKGPNFKFKQSQVVQVSVDLQAGSICWQSKNMERYQVLSKTLSQKDISWVPYIRLTRGCQIQLVI